MEIRSARPADLPAVRSLWEQGFGNEQPYTNWYFRAVYRPERTLCLYQQGQLAAATQFAPYTLRLRGRLLPTAYLVGVVTEQSMQRQGCGHKLLSEALDRLQQQGFAMAMLYTDIPAFYQPLGFVHCYSLRQLTFPALPAAIPPGWRRGGVYARDIQQLNAIYQRMTKNWDGYILRSAEQWRNFLDELRCDEGQIWLSRNAYVLWHEEEQRPLLRELGFVDEASLHSAIGMGRVLAARCGYEQAVWNAPLPAPLPRSEEEVLIPYVMALSLEQWPQLQGAELAAATRELFDENCWVNEKT